MDSPVHGIKCFRKCHWSLSPWSKANDSVWQEGGRALEARWGKAGERLGNRKQTACTFGGLLDSMPVLCWREFPNSNQGVENGVERREIQRSVECPTTSTGGGYERAKWNAMPHRKATLIICSRCLHGHHLRRSWERHGLVEEPNLLLAALKVRFRSMRSKL